MVVRSEGKVLFSVVIRPNRSASIRGLKVLIFVLSGFSFVVGLGFFLLGAWPVVPFLGLDVLLLAAALRFNLFASKAYEAISLTAKALTVRRVNHWGTQTNVSFQPNWLQVNIEVPPQRWSPLELRSHGRSMVIGAFLLPEERLQLANSLRRELDRVTRPGLAT